jgi:DNA-directed RNA polymerase specialized sigma24 family protein
MGAHAARITAMTAVELRAGAQVVTDIYHAQYRSLVRLAALLTGDAGWAQEIVEDSFVAMHCYWGQLKDEGRALRFLRRSIVTRSRSLHKRRAGSDSGAADGLAGPVISALAALPPRQREALVLTFYLALPDEEIAAAMGVSRSAVRTHTAKAKAALTAIR